MVFFWHWYLTTEQDYTPVKFMIKCFEANYPESLGAVLVHKAPWIFQGTPAHHLTLHLSLLTIFFIGIWAIIRGWLDPVVAGKVHFTKNVDELSSFIDLPNIPTELGGEEDWSYQYVEVDPNENPKLSDEAGRESLLAKHAELVKKYESTVLEWIHEGEEGHEKKEMEERRVERNMVAEELRRNYWESDPYLRAKSLYDRIGVIGPKGELNFFPQRKKAEEKVAPVTSEEDLD